MADLGGVGPGQTPAGEGVGLAADNGCFRTFPVGEGLPEFLRTVGRRQDGGVTFEGISGSVGHANRIPDISKTCADT